MAAARMPATPLDALEARLRRELTGEVLFDAFSRGRYATDASIYQIDPLGVVVPRTSDEAVRAAELAADAGVPILPRGAGTSQCGQTVGAALVIDLSKHVNRLLDVDTSTGYHKPFGLSRAFKSSSTMPGSTHAVAACVSSSSKRFR